MAMRERRGDEPLICSEFGVWGLPHPREILESGRQRAVVVRERARLEPRQRLSARDRDALSRRRARADLRRPRRLRRARRRTSSIARSNTRSRRCAGSARSPAMSSPSSTTCSGSRTASWTFSNRPRAFAERLANLQRPVARHRASAAHGGSRGRALRRFGSARGRRRDAGGREARLALRGQSGEAALGPEPTTISLTAGAVDAIAIVPLELEARDGGGRLLSRNEIELCIVPPLGGRGAVAVPDRRRGARRRSPRSAGRIAPRRPRRRRSCSRRGSRLRFASRCIAGRKVAADRQFRRCADRSGAASFRSTTGTTSPRCC